MSVCAEPGCISVVTVAGELCQIHRDICKGCGFPGRMHPVVRMTEEFGAVCICYDFQSPLPADGKVERA